jgi:ferredoxin-NADP reductase
MTLEATTVAGTGTTTTRPLPPIAAGARAGLNVAPNATLVERHDLTGSIARFRIRPDEVAPAVEPGQYFALGLPVDRRLLQRPYSTATPRGAQRFERWAAEGRRISYRPAVSRPADPVNLGWGGAVGRIDALLDAVFAAEGLQPRETVAYLCGNPEMIAAGERILAERGLPTDAIRSEHYWPAGSMAGASPRR